ncbi:MULTISPECIES: GNAT family acetyltransferase [unclassified Sphingomonas]|uniref:GNAT family acetyltransferase n=1 Tax=unclassified Sphingomonas TaxID=196159 RepID=UPI0006F48906|nr:MULTISPECIES: GNAT family acetyltransferase [unclassified Sphingomonas]KQM61377.1 acetyltransferase [Sphingomonas sp. Leaf16]KQN12472.1 acetyltransferase [Sphingomonas sp. Leaf29]KQN18953.1 acetyltransferase [Sphingomonas sp. Leaf32]
MGRQHLHRPVIDDATPADAAAVVALWHACGLTRPWNDPDADFTRALDGATSTILLARQAGVPIGSVMVGHDGHRGWLYYLAVRPDARGQGVGTALFDAAEQWLRARSVPKLQLMVREDNAAALAFYDRIGLERQGVVVLGRFLTRP